MDEWAAAYQKAREQAIEEELDLEEIDLMYTTLLNDQVNRSRQQ